MRKLGCDAVTHQSRGWPWRWRAGAAWCTRGPASWPRTRCCPPPTCTSGCPLTRYGTSWWQADHSPLQAPAPTLTHHLVMSTKQQGNSHNSELRQRPFRDENVCFIQTTSFYIPISTWFPCLGPGHIQSCHSLLNADKLISITGTLLLSPTLMLDFADIFRKQ